MSPHPRTSPLAVRPAFRIHALWITAVSMAPLATAQLPVDTVEDVVDFPPPRTVAELPGPDGRVSFREAILAANNTPGPNTVSFAIPTSEWWLVNDMAVLRLDGQGPVLFDDETTLDFGSQTQFTGDTNPFGPEVGIYGIEPNFFGKPAIHVAGDNCVVSQLGYVWNRVSVAIVRGSGNRIVGCVTPTIQLGDTTAPGATANIVGGTQPGDGNVLDAVELACFAHDNVIVGNRVKTVQLDGSAGCALPTGNRIGGPSPEERNVISGFGSFSSEGLPIGQGVDVVRSVGTLVEGNFIGLTDDGLAVAPGNGPTGVHVSGASDTTIRGNVIAGMRVVGKNHFGGQLFGRAIHLDAISDDVLGVAIEGNLIGTDATGVNGLLTLTGILVRSSSNQYQSRDVRIGGPAPGQGNLIAFTEQDGVIVQFPNQEVDLAGNSIHSNGGLGIELGTLTTLDGVTPNDPGDLDENGGNHFQNFPRLLLAQSVQGRVTILGRLNSRANRVYRLDFFASSAADPSGHGEGERFLGSLDVTTGPQGRSPFLASFDAHVRPGEFVTSTATDLLDHATSEFSAARKCGPLPVGPQ